MSAIGAPPSGRWHRWQLRWRIGAMCLVKVTSGLSADLSAEALCAKVEALCAKVEALCAEVDGACAAGVAEVRNAPVNATIAASWRVARIVDSFVPFVRKPPTGTKITPSSRSWQCEGQHKGV